MRLTETVALVTGASRGLGKGIALGLGEAGATVYITGRSEDAAQSPFPGTLRETAEEVTALGGHGIAIRCDHRVDSDVEAVFTLIQQDHQRLDLLVNNATALPVPRVLWGEQPFWEAPLAIWDDLLNVGLRSHYVASWFAAPIMIKQGRGLIINISSGAAVARWGLLPYSIGKCALDRLSADMAEELAPHGVSVLSVWPPPTRTEAVLAQADVFEDQGLHLEKAMWHSPLLTGRVIAALASDSAVSARSGKALTIGALAAELKVGEGPSAHPVVENDHAPVYFDRPGAPGTI